jgi:dTDP-4-amino-4,6-dideoxygalactose transaminase
MMGTPAAGGKVAPCQVRAPSPISPLDAAAKANDSERMSETVAARRAVPLAPPPPGPPITTAMRRAAARLLATGELSDPRGDGITYRFESALSHHLQAAGAIATSSGTAALDLALAVATDGRPDAAVAVPEDLSPYLWERVARVGAAAVPVALDPQRGTLDPGALQGRGTPPVCAILAVDADGVPCDLAGLMEVAADLGALVIEDAASALGGRDGPRQAGQGAHLTVASLAWGKPLVGGEGGALTAASRPLWQRARQHRQRAAAGRLHPVAAALALASMPGLARRAARRQRRAQRLWQQLRRVVPDSVRPMALPAGVAPSGAAGLRLRYTPGPADPTPDLVARRADAVRLDVDLKPIGGASSGPAWRVAVPFWDLSHAAAGDLDRLAESIAWLFRPRAVR